MAATLRDLRSQLRSRRTHYGFGQEPVPPKSTKPKNYALARWILDNGIPTTDQDWAEIKKAEKSAKSSEKPDE